MTVISNSFNGMPEQLATQDSLVAMGVAIKALAYVLSTKGLITHAEMTAQLAGGRTFVGANRPAALPEYDQFAAWLLS